jgi:Flp pilus assembly pilin Flp
MADPAVADRRGTPNGSGSDQTSRLFRWFVLDEDGQAFVEYVLLALLVVVLTIPALNALQGALKATYESWNTAMLDLWQMPAPH